MQSITLDGKRYVVVPGEEYDRLARAARLPAYPDACQSGNFPAIEYTRVSLARKLILRREALGWSQAAAARQAGIPKETLCRLETGKTTPSIATVDKLDRAFSAVEEATRNSEKRNRRDAAKTGRSMSRPGGKP